MSTRILLRHLVCSAQILNRHTQSLAQDISIGFLLPTSTMSYGNEAGGCVANHCMLKTTELPPNINSSPAQRDNPLRDLKFSRMIETLTIRMARSLGIEGVF